MKKLLLALLVLSCAVNVKAQDTVLIRHHAYASVFIKHEKIPLFVVYDLYDKEVDCNKHFKRTDKFVADPMLPGTNYNSDYAASGYDRGHNMSAEDNSCDSTNMVECFYFTNMFPQHPKLNRGTWKTLEEHERELAGKFGHIVVTIGSIPGNKTIGKDKVVVPEYCWKVIYIVNRGTYEMYMFPNRQPDSNDISTYQIKPEAFFAQTQVAFDKGVPEIK